MKDNIAIWAYPWDVHDIGLDETVARVTGAGASIVSLATSYHAGRFLQPGNPRRRVYFPEDGTVYYAVDPARWSDAEIRPREAAIVSAEGDMLRALTDRRDAGGPRVSCWTVCLHNSRLGADHPDHALRNCFGDPVIYGLCPSSPAARHYVATMVDELCDRYGPDRIELESPDFMGFDHGYHHEKDGLPLNGVEQQLIGLCFCDHCLRGAAEDGVDALAARDMILRYFDAAFARDLPAPPAEAGACRDSAAVRAFIRWRARPVTAVIAAASEAAAGRTELALIDHAGSGLGGVDRAMAAPHVQSFLYCAYTQPADEIGQVLSALRAEIGSAPCLHVGFQLFHPNVADRRDLAARIAAAAPHADGINAYNLGLVPPARLDWLRAAVAATEGARHA